MTYTIYHHNIVDQQRNERKTIGNYYNMTLSYENVSKFRSFLQKLSGMCCLKSHLASKTMDRHRPHEKIDSQIEYHMLHVHGSYFCDCGMGLI